MTIERPFFIVGAERSGTTLLRLMLDHHPRIACHNEFDHCVMHVTDDGRFPELDEFHRWLPTTRYLRASGAIIDPSLDYPELVDSFLEQKRRRDGKELIGAAIHQHFDRLLHIWPDARFIHIVRDPRDVASSCVAMGWAGNVWGGVERWRRAERLWDHLITGLDADRYIDCRSEDLIGEAQKSLGEVCSFLGVTFDEAMFGYAETSTYGLPDPTRVAPWRTQVPARDVQLVEARCRDLLLRRDYSLSDHPPLELSAAEEATLKAEDRRGRRIFRIKRYGLPLFVVENITRRLPLRSLHDLFVRRMAAIDEEFIK